MNIAATNTYVNLGENVTIECSVQRGKASYNSFSIVHNDTGNTVSTEQLYTLTNIQVADLGIYYCNVSNKAGAGSANVLIEKGGESLVIICGFHAVL